MRPVPSGVQVPKQSIFRGKIFQPWQTQLPVSLRPPLPQLPAQTVQRRPLLLRRTSSWRTSVHSDVVCRASMRTTLGVHLWRRELARSDACCRWHQVMFSSLNKKKSFNFQIKVVSSLSSQLINSDAPWVSGSLTMQTFGSLR